MIVMDWVLKRIIFGKQQKKGLILSIDVEADPNIGAGNTAIDGLG